MHSLISSLPFILLSFNLISADLQFGKSKTIPPEIDSSSQYRSVIMPRIFGGGEMEKPIKTGNGPYSRQRYYKPAAVILTKNNTECPLSPYAIYLSEEDQADLYILVKSARDDKVPENDIKLLMEEYVRNSISPEKFVEFQRDNRAFETRLQLMKLDRSPTRLFSKQRQKSFQPKNHRQLKEHINDAAYFGLEKGTVRRVGA